MDRQKLPWNAARQAALADRLRDLPGISGSKVGGNEGNRQISSGIVGDLFNLLARPGRAVAGGVYSAVDRDPETSVLSGVAEGLSGRGQRNFSDVLGELGVKNRFAKSVGGFGLDIATDPLTYLGIKGQRGISATEALSEATREALKRNIAPNVLGDTAHRLAATLERENPGRLYVEFAGKRIGPGFVTPHKVANIIKDGIVGPDGDRRMLAQLFSRDSELGKDLAGKARVWESGSSGAFEKHQRGIQDIYNSLDQSDQKLVSYALEEGADLSTVLPSGGVRIEGMNTLEDYKKLARAQLDIWFDDELTLGIRKPEDYSANYVPKYFQGRIPEEFPGLSPAAQVRMTKRMGTLPKDLQNVSLRKLEQLPGYDPLVNINDIMTQRAAAHYRNVGRAQLRRDAVESYGVKLDAKTPEMDAALREMNMIPVKHIAGPGIDDYAEAGYYLPEHMVKTLNQTERVLTDTTTGNQFMRWYDKVMHQWKFLNTSVNPGYWTRNSMSDGIMNFMDGVRNPKYYQQATRVLTEHRAGTTSEMLGLIGKGGAPKTTLVDFGGHRVPTTQVWSDFIRAGGKTGDITTNLQASLDPTARQGLGNFIDKNVQGVGGAINKGESKLMDWNNMREDWFRLSHFMSATEDGMRRGLSYEDAVAKAGQRVRKYNIDYGQLSSFERKYVRRVVPFYSWMRRNTPLQIELMFTRPGYMAAYSKGNDLMQGLLGTDDGSGDYMVPKWIRDTMPVRLAMANNKSSNPLDKLIRMASGAKGDEAVFMSPVSSMSPLGDIQHVTNPIQAFTERGGLTSPGAATMAGVGAVAKDVVNMATPAIKAPVEIATGKSLYTGAPIEDWKNYLIGQLAPGRNVNAALQGKRNNLTSALTGLQMQPVTAARQKGEFRRRQDVLQAYINRRGGKGTQARQWQRYLRQSGKSVGA